MTETRPETLADRLGRVRAATFVGREREIALFRSALRRDDPSTGFAVLYVWGGGGIGKSALLRRLGDEAEAAGRRVVRVDARTIERSPAGFERAAVEAMLPGRVLFVDTFEAVRGLEDWFWEVFLPRLPAGTLVVLAGRRAPDPARTLHPEWSAAVRVAPLEVLSDAEAVTLLRLRGVPEARTGALLGVAGGHPLVLVLAAEVGLRNPIDPDRWSPHQPAIKMLLDRLVGDLPSPAHRRALEICAHVLVTREDLLRGIFGEQGADLFAWLREQPFVEAGPYGLRPHDLVRDLLIADLRWRDPQEWRAVHEQVHPYFVERAVAATGAEELPAVMALNYLHRHGDTMARFVSWRGQGEVYEDAYRPGDRDAVLAMARQLEGPGGAAAVDFWLRRQPEAFRVCRRPGTAEPVAFVAWLRLFAPDAGENAADPVIGALWAHASRTAPPRPGTKIAVQRFINVGGAAPEPSPASDLLYLRGAAVCLREPALAWTYIVMPNPDRWAPVLEYVVHERLGGELSAVFAHDWAAVPVRPWLDMMHDRLLYGSAPEANRPAGTALARPDFDRAVRDLLRNWRHRPSIEASPLLRTRLAGDGTPDERAERLRETVEEAVDALRGTSRGDDLHRTLAATFFHGGLTQEAAAQRLGIAFGTYRHRLSAATDQVAEILWQRATGGMR
jgi:hypothetical protein